jgi:hypothetical protein
VNVHEPRWLKERRGTVTGYQIDFEVTLEVLASQKDLFNEENVSVIIDLTDLKEGDLEMDESQPGKVTGKPKQQLYLRLIIDQKLNYKLPDNVTLEQYYPVVMSQMTLEWPS